MDVSTTLHAALPYIVGVSVASLGVMYMLNKGVRDIPTKPANYFSVPVGDDTATGASVLFLCNFFVSLEQFSYSDTQATKSSINPTMIGWVILSCVMLKDN